jgi:hypothetical protein
MTKLHTWLTGLLAVQVVLAGALIWHNQHSLPQATNEPLLSFEKATVDALVITDAEQTLRLEKDGDDWRLPELHQLPVVENKATELLEKLQSVNVRWPVATTSTSHERFEVAEEKFQRRIQLFAGEEKVGEVFLGTSPGFRKVHVRRTHENEIYTVDLNTYDIPVAQSDWLDKSLLGISDLQQIKGPDYELKKSDNQWAFANPASQDHDEEVLKVDNQKAQELANALSNLRIVDVADKMPDGEPVIITVTSGAGEMRYEFIKADEQYYVKRQDQQQLFTMNQFDYDRITQIRQPQLALKSEEQNADVEEDKTNG